MPVDDSAGLAPQAPTDEPGAGSARSTRNSEAADDTDHEEVSAGSERDDLALRGALADLDNVRKRYERELARAHSLERAAVAAEWLPIVDDLERALDHSDGDAAALLEGVRAVHDHAVALLARLGFPRFDDVGKPFDPHRHEAVGVVDDETTPGTVIGIVRPGYDGLGTVLRPAGVVVSRGE